MTDLTKLSPELLAALSKDQLIALVDALKQDARAPNKLTLKVSAKGAVSLYGMGQWPVTLYATQWERLLSEADTIRAFIAANKASLAVKPAKS
jgi:hypothetical protein